MSRNEGQENSEPQSPITEEAEAIARAEYDRRFESNLRMRGDDTVTALLAEVVANTEEFGTSETQRRLAETLSELQDEMLNREPPEFDPASLPGVPHRIERGQ